MAKQIFRRKFSVPGNTIQECKHMPCQKLNEKNNYNAGEAYGHKEPCVRKLTEQELNKYQQNQLIHICSGYNWNRREYIVKDCTICPYKDRLGKPKNYIVAEKMDGTVVCDCPAGKFKRDAQGNTTCTHRDTAYANPKKYEIPVEATASDVDTINAL